MCGFVSEDLGYLYAFLGWFLVSGDFFGTDFKCMQFYFDAELVRVPGVCAGVFPILWHGVLRGVPGVRVHLHPEVPRGEPHGVLRR